MKIWIPSQEQSSKHYFRLGAITSFITIMMWTGSFFYDEYKEAEVKKKEAQLKIAQIEEHNIKVDQQEPTKAKQIKIKHRTLALPDGTKICTDPDEAAKTGCRFVDNAEFDKILKAVNSKPKLVMREKSADPEGGSPPPVAVAAPEPSKLTEKEVIKTIPAEPVKDSKIEIDAGLVKFAMSNEASWTAIIKMVSTVLFTFFGIKLINLVFRRLDTNSQ